ncbi:transcription antitermination factor NusB [bacterium DOLZORAL124_38_8]|nr:MAG: transcription antitermination factor NusB [bacterium DOLZORAL124_38_8]
MDKKQARRESRITAIQAFFFYTEREKKIPLQECLKHITREIDHKEAGELVTEILEKAEAHFGKIKLVIKAFATDVAYEKIAPINRAILHLGLTEMKYLETPPVVVINEYIEIAKLFGEEKSAPLINAVLDSYKKELHL